MKKLKFKFKIIIPIILILITGILISTSNAFQGEKYLRDIQISFQNKESNYFIDSDNIKHLINANHLIGEPLRKVNIAKIEKKLKNNPFVKSIETYMESNGILKIDLEIKNVIARVYNSKGDGFYIDDKNKKMPLSSIYSARTLLVTGNLNENINPIDTLKSSPIKELLPMLNYIKNNEFLRAFVSEVAINEQKEISIYPEVGNFKIEFGTFLDYESKFINLQNFLKNVLPKTGWDFYECINLKFKDQVVAKKR